MGRRKEVNSSTGEGSIIMKFENIQYDLTRIPYGRRGTFYYLGLWKENGEDVVYICALLSEMDTSIMGRKPRMGRLFPVQLMRNGEKIAYTATATPLCVTLNYDGGTARLCLQEGSILRMEAENAEVILAPHLEEHEIAKDRGDGSWEMALHPVPKLLFYAVEGELQVKTGFNVITSMPEDTRFHFKPNEQGKLDFAIHMYKFSEWKHKKYPTVDEVIHEIEDEFAEYMETVPPMAEEFAEARIINAYIVWSHIMHMDDTYIIFMNKGVHRCTSSWQQCYHAIGQYRNPRFAWELLLSVFRYQNDYGMLPDLLTDSSQIFDGTKPPFQGVAMEFLKEFTDFRFATRKELLTLYRGLSDWVYWWLSYRDVDQDGIVQYDAADESGFDDSSFFKLGGQTASPDLATYLILAMDNLGDLAERLGKSYESREWKKRAQDMLDKMLKFFWNGKKFEARRGSDFEWVDSGTIMSFVPLLLGKNRLPQEIIDTMAEALSEEGKWLSPYGLAGERMDTDHFQEKGWSAGPVLAPPQMMVCLGLRACGKDELAREITLRYCRALVDANFPMVMSPLSGIDLSERRWNTRYPNRMAWMAVVFLTLGSLYN